MTRTPTPIPAFLLASLLLSLLQGITLPKVAVASSFKPTLLANTEAFLAIDDNNTLADVVLRFGDTINKTLTYERSLTRFKFDDDVYITNTLGVASVFSGAVVRGQKTLASSGTLVWEGQGSGAGLYLGGTFEGAGLSTDCDGDTQTVSWDSTFKRFGCGDDDTGGAGAPEVGTSSFSGAVRTVGDAKYVLKQGDTMTGSLTLAGSGHLLLATTATSGSIVRTATTVDSTGTVGKDSSVAIGIDGMPIISSIDVTNTEVKVLKCGNAACTGGNITTTVTSASKSVEFTSIAIGTDGLPVIAYHGSNSDNLMLVKCGNSACSSGNVTSTANDDTNRVGLYPSIAIGADGFPVISHYEFTIGDLRVTKCGNASCSSATTTVVDNSANDVGRASEIAIGPDGLPIIAYQDQTADDVKILKCGNASCSDGNTITTINGSDIATGKMSLTIGSDGLPVIGYVEHTLGDLIVLKCGNAACSSGNSRTTVDADAVRHQNSMVVAPDGLPVISYHYNTGGDLRITKCGDPGCRSGNTTTAVDTTNVVGTGSSIAIGSDGLPIVSYTDTTSGDLKVLRCADPTCSKTSASAFTNGRTLGSFRGNGRSFSPGFEFINTAGVGSTSAFRSLNFFTNGVARMTLTTSGKVGIGTTTPDTLLEVAGTSSGSITIGGAISGVVIIPQAFSGAGLSNCVGSNKLLWTQATGRFSCTADETGGAGIVNHYVLASGDTMTGSLTLAGSGHLLSGLAATSGSVTLTTVNVDTVPAFYTSIAIGTDGFPVIAYSSGSTIGTSDLRVTKCGNVTCTAGNTSSVVDTVDIQSSSIAIAPDGLPVISYRDATNNRFRVTKCGNAACSAGNVTSTVDTVNGDDTSIAIAPDGLPVFSYRDTTNSRLKVTKCGNAACSSGNTSSNVDTVLGERISIAIGTDGLPVISYRNSTNSRLKVTKCGNSACTAGNVSSTLDTVNGTHTSLAIGLDGFPVISYENATNSTLKVVKCFNAACSGSGYVATTVDTVDGQFTSIAIPPDGLPVISYRDATNSRLKVLKCGNAACTAGNVSTNVDTVHGMHTSIAIGTDGLPVISYRDATNLRLKVARCAESTCSKAAVSAYTRGTRIGAPRGNERSYVPAFEDISAVSVGNPSGFRNLSFFSNGVERMTITPSGFIGINTTAPREALEVAGNILLGAQVDAQTHRFASTCNCRTNTTAGTFGSTASVDGVFSTAVFQGKLYAGTTETDNAGVYRYDGNGTWTLVSDATVGKIITGDTDNVDAIVLTPYNGKLYAGTQTAANTGALYAYDGTTWSLVNATRGTFGAETARDGVSDIHVWNGQLFVATQELNGTTVVRYDGGTTFTKISAVLPGEILAADATDGDSTLLLSYAGKLWAGVTTGSTTGRVFSYDGSVWILQQLTRGTFQVGTGSEPDVNSMAVFNGQLFIGIGRTNLANIYVFKGGTELSTAPTSGDKWLKTTSTSGRIDATNDATDVDGVTALKAYNGRLYAGSNTANLASVYEYTGISTASANGWTLVNATRGTFGANSSVDTVRSLVELNGTLYVGTQESNVGSVYTFNKVNDNSYGLKFASTGSNFASMSFIGEQQAQDNSQHQGTFIFSHPLASTTGAFDYAEDYPTLDASLEAGEIVAVDASVAEYVRRADADAAVLGVVSGRPGFRLGPTAQAGAEAAYVAVALVGRVPVKVSGENGAIKPGDPLTISSVPGVAMKATAPGPVLGHALGSYAEPGIGSVLFYVNIGHFDGN